jgi:hypothetical protein
LLVVDVEIQPIDFDRVFFERSTGRRADDISRRFVWFEKKLSIYSALDFAVCSVCFDPSGSIGHGGDLLSPLYRPFREIVSKNRPI